MNRFHTITLFAASTAWSSCAMAQPFDLDWFTIDGGGGTSVRNAIEVSGTIGQPDAGEMTGGGFELIGGFWGVAADTQSGCDSIDFNNDGLFPDTADIDDLLSVFSGGPCSTGNCNDIDFNNDGLFPDTTDIDAFLNVFSGGPCL
jgi:hypothetical protein